MSIPNSVLQKEHVAITFGTPVSSYLWPDSDALNAALKKVILEKEKADEESKEAMQAVGTRSRTCSSGKQTVFIR